MIHNTPLNGRGKLYMMTMVMEIQKNYNSNRNERSTSGSSEEGEIIEYVWCFPKIEN